MRLARHEGQAHYRDLPAETSGEDGDPALQRDAVPESVSRS
ncbi:hypothetical protein [Streptomyces tagetis]|nr:hypothetical protein [Streptomyces sp. RG38]